MKIENMNLKKAPPELRKEVMYGFRWDLDSDYAWELSKLFAVNNPEIARLAFDARTEREWLDKNNRKSVDDNTERSSLAFYRVSVLDKIMVPQDAERV